MNKAKHFTYEINFKTKTQFCLNYFVSKLEKSKIQKPNYEIFYCAEQNVS